MQPFVEPIPPAKEKMLAAERTADSERQPDTEDTNHYLSDQVGLLQIITLCQIRY